MFFRKTLLVVASILHILQSAETPLTPKTPSPSRLPALPDEAFVLVDYTHPILPFTDASEYGSYLAAQQLALQNISCTARAIPSVAFDDLAKVALLVDVVQRVRQASTSKLNVLGLTVDLEDLDNAQYLFMVTAYAARRLGVKRRSREVLMAICILGGLLVSSVLRFGEGPEPVDVVVAVVRQVCRTRRPSLTKVRRTTRRQAYDMVRKSVHLAHSHVRYLDVRLLLMTFMSFEMPIMHLAWALVLDGTAVSGLAASVCSCVSLQVQIYRQPRRRACAIARKSTHLVHSVVLYLDIRLLLMTVLPFDIPMVHLAWALLLDGTALRVLATKVTMFHHVPDEVFPSPIIKARRAKKRYKRGRKTKPQ
ncbi:hypothetical protein R3P38DRAFT_3265315 [Favolaschia claudopus]|uniref:Uncharacterized protein n=1 Tax=Favolaschia claudopus TaxID=2862362 RepID=A0AAW0C4I7_9AGAR